jgi:hypothetical protein
LTTGGPAGKGPKGETGGGTQGATGDQGAKGQKGPQGSPSDRRFKDNVKGLKGNYAKLLKLKGLYFDWKQDTFTQSRLKGIKGTDIGFIAQDVLEIVPEVVHLEGDTYTIEYDKMVVLAIGSIQEQQTRLNYLSEKIKTYKKLLNNG